MYCLSLYTKLSELGVLVCLSLCMRARRTGNPNLVVGPVLLLEAPPLLLQGVRVHRLSVIYHGAATNRSALFSALSKCVATFPSSSLHFRAAKKRHLHNYRRRVTWYTCMRHKLMFILFFFFDYLVPRFPFTRARQRRVGRLE